METLNKFDLRQGATENFPYTADDFQLISAGAGSGLQKMTDEEEDSDDKMKEWQSCRMLILYKSNQ